MQRALMLSLRAHFVLFSMSICFAEPVNFLMKSVLSLFRVREPLPLFQTGTVVIGILIAGFAHWHARKAFRHAFSSLDVTVVPGGIPSARISERCTKAWLVQLYLELKGCRCAN